MNELLQKHGCANVFTVPEGLKELMSDITREVLREQPQKVLEFIANYLSVLLLTREHGVLTVKILEDLCDCKPTVSEHLIEIGMNRIQAETVAQIIKAEIEALEPSTGKEKVKEMQIMKKILTRLVLDEETAARVCQVARNAYRDFWYRKKLMEKNLKMQSNEPWEIAAERTLSLYKKTKPSFAELTRATIKIQAAYRGYYVRKNLLQHLRPRPKAKTGPKVELPGPPIDIAASRQMNLGPMINIQVKEDDVAGMFENLASKKLGIQYDAMKTITNINGINDEDDNLAETRINNAVSRVSEQPSVKSLQIRTRPSRVVTVPAAEQNSVRLSFAPEAVQTIPRPSSISAKSPADSLHSSMVFFADVPPEIISIDTDAMSEEKAETLLVQEIPEEINIPDDRTEGDGKSSVTASLPSSAPDTPNITDGEEE